MKKVFTFIAVLLLITSCKNAQESFVLSGSIGKTNKILVVMKSSHWLGELGDELRDFIGKPLVGLPQPETIFSVGQVSPKGFGGVMNKSRNVLVIEEGDKEGFAVKNNLYAEPQTLIYVTAKDQQGLLNQLKKYEKQIIKIFKDSEIQVLQSYFSKEKLDDSKFKTISKLGISLTIPNSYRTVDDTGDFLWLRQHLLSGIAKGDGTNNILVYSLPLQDESIVEKQILAVRDSIGKKYIPGSREGMYMITEAAYTPVTYPANISGRKAFETRGKWEVKNDFMAGPFLNYTIIDKENNRVLVVEGFTYAPSVNKREFVFELEAIAKSLTIQLTKDDSFLD
ncbi:DUF4837 domain-containing protein [Polaribacter pacificus]|uniref:DUF4837 domain-containing protein n=1 Tax=Polaribacter pacificus TaxID=1775173 RepID=A0A917MEE3_9FLAO|nr:DUF4837 family protein [Polaribacter pacificus]GGG92984.1 DUF4837 domain-containing protein [Polaribacter pacificus]